MIYIEGLARFLSDLFYYRYFGEGGIRTPGSARINGFQDRRFRPLSHLSLRCRIPNWRSLDQTISTAMRRRARYTCNCWHQSRKPHGLPGSDSSGNGYVQTPRGRDYSGYPCPRPCGAALRAFKIVPDDLVEPPDPRGSTVFKTAAFDRSATSPCAAEYRNDRRWASYQAFRMQHRSGPIE